MTGTQPPGEYRVIGVDHGHGRIELPSQRMFVRYLNARLGRSLPEDRGVSAEQAYLDYRAAHNDEGWLR